MSQPAWRAAATEPLFAEPASAARAQRLQIRFTASGSEYFRIWIVNLLLTIVTLGAYHPWAKVRKLRYFYGNTLVGDQPLDFHGDPWAMLRGYLLVGVMVALYSVAGRFSLTAGFVAFLVVAAVWPALLKASMQFRLANTSWRGLRFRFLGTLEGAYGAITPMLLPVAVIVGVNQAFAGQARPPLWAGLGVLATMAVGFIAAPWLWWKLKKYQHDHYAFGAWRTRLVAGRGSFYGVSFKTLGVGLLCLLPLGLVAALLTAVPGKRGPSLLLVTALPVLLLLMQAVPRAFLAARMQNLLWSRTEIVDAGRFESALRFGQLLGLTLKNGLLIVLTLGLYWPFAAIALQRLKLEAVSIVLHEDLDALTDRVRANAGDATGDAAGDLLGFDIGL
jgi:uncharacterized membrane protein YjgN (DUF898 family)